MSIKQAGVIGMAVMGKNLAMNIAEHGYAVSVYNRSPERARQAVAEAAGLKLKACDTIEEFVYSLKPPRVVIMMVKAGQPVDDTIRQLLPLLSKGDVLIDGGNSYYPDTMRRFSVLEAAGIRYLGTGISGGEEGARRGPAIMPGGDENAYDIAAPILQAHRGQSGGRTLLRVYWQGGRRPFCEDGAQRHRVCRYAADL